MARNNYAYQKYRRELAKKKKKEEKLQRKLEKKNVAPEGNADSAPSGDAAVTD